MSEFMFGVTKTKPSTRERDRWDRICKELGGNGYTEVNRKRGQCPGINNGEYQGWFATSNYGSPHDKNFAEKVYRQIGKFT